MKTRSGVYAAMCLVLVVTGCASRPAEPSSGGSAAAAGTGGPTPDSPGPPSSTLGCGSGERITIHQAQPPQPVCLPIGATLSIDAPASPLQPWQPFTTSNARLITCTTTVSRDGSATGTCRALRPGQATITTTTAAFSGDPHGPAQQLWQLAVTIRS
jgi:hypothetical protein